MSQKVTPNSAAPVDSPEYAAWLNSRDPVALEVSRSLSCWVAKIEEHRESTRW
jgi:hypothetical protein